MYCWKCGKEIDDDAVVCVHCGVAAKKQPEQVQQPVINVVNTNTNVNTFQSTHPVGGGTRDKAGQPLV